MGCAGGCSSVPLSLRSPVFPCWKQPCSSPAVAQALLGGCLQQPRPEQSRNLSLLRCLTHSCSQNEDQGLRRRNEREWTVSFGWVWVGFFFPFLHLWGYLCHCTPSLLHPPWDGNSSPEERVVGTSRSPSCLHLPFPADSWAAPTAPNKARAP